MNFEILEQFDQFSEFPKQFLKISSRTEFFDNEQLIMSHSLRKGAKLFPK